MTIKKSLHFDEYLESPEWKIRVEVSEMLSYFLTIGKKHPIDREWKSGFRKRLTNLFVLCENNNISPIPEELLELESHLYGKKTNVYQVEKYFVASCLSHEFDIEDIVEKRKEIICYANDVLNETGGLQKNMKNYRETVSGKNERAKTIKRFLADEDFLEDWNNKRLRYKHLQKRYNLNALVEMANGAIKK